MKPRTIDTVRFEIESLERTRDSALSAAHALHLKTDMEARLRATTAVGKIEREYAAPAREEARKARDAAQERAKKVHEAAVAAAHGALKVAMSESQAVYEDARMSISQTASTLIAPHETTLRGIQADSASAHEAEREAARKEFYEKVKPLHEEFQKFQAALKTVESEIPLVDPEAKPKKNKGLEAGR